MINSNHNTKLNLNGYPPTKRYFIAKLLNYSNLEEFYVQALEYANGMGIATNSAADHYFLTIKSIDNAPLNNWSITAILLKDSVTHYKIQAELEAENILKKFGLNLKAKNKKIETTSLKFNGDYDSAQNTYSFFNHKHLILAASTAAAVVTYLTLS